MTKSKWAIYHLVIIPPRKCVECSLKLFRMWTVKNSLRKKNYWSLMALHLIYAPSPLPSVDEGLWNFRNPRKNALFTPKPSENSPYESNTVNKFLLSCFLPSENLAINLTTLTNFCFFANSPPKIWVQSYNLQKFHVFVSLFRKFRQREGGVGGILNGMGLCRGWFVLFVMSILRLLIPYGPWEINWEWRSHLRSCLTMSSKHCTKS